VGQPEPLIRHISNPEFIVRKTMIPRVRRTASNCIRLAPVGGQASNSGIHLGAIGLADESLPQWTRGQFGTDPRQDQPVAAWSAARPHGESVIVPGKLPNCLAFVTPDHGTVEGKTSKRRITHRPSTFSFSSPVCRTVQARVF
jgi:hypothetical protein